MPDDSLELLTQKQVAGRLSISLRSFQRLVESGAFPQPVRINGAPRWFVGDVTAYRWGLIRAQLAASYQAPPVV